MRSGVEGGFRGALLSGAGNRFVLIDGLAGPVPADASALARELVGRAAEGDEGIVPDGLLLLLPPRAGGELRMVVFNRDGTRPEACGNGLRCLAHHALGAGHVDAPHFVVETDAGPRRVRVREAPDGVQQIVTELGAARVLAAEEPLETAAEELVATLVDVGVPHCVVFRDELEQGEILRLGPALERHARFAAGTNVELAERTRDGLSAHVWERGVGETAACGTGAAAVAAAAAARFGLTLPLATEMPGGTLTVEGDPARSLWLSGAVEGLGTLAGVPREKAAE